MTSLNELRKSIEREKRKETKRKERTDLEKQLCELQNKRKIKPLNIGMKMGKGIRKKIRGISENFNEQRKKKKGIGGFLQRVADKQ